MAARPNPFLLGPDVMQTLAHLSSADQADGPFDPEIIALVRARTLQLLGGRFGKTPCRAIAAQSPALASKVASLENWYASRAFSPRERAALLWAEDIVYAPADGVPDMSYESAARDFRPDELWALTVAIVFTCAWAQMAKVFRTADITLC